VLKAVMGADKSDAPAVTSLPVVSAALTITFFLVSTCRQSVQPCYLATWIVFEVHSTPQLSIMSVQLQASTK